jgi:mono/diheme cytochrome c family protein
MKKIFLIFSTFAILFVGCKTPAKTTEAKDTVAKPKTDCVSPTPTYADDIKVIIGKHCISCHNGNGVEGYDFSTTDALIKAGKNGDLLATIKHKGGFPQMPARADKLDEKTISIIECWINSGMK